MKNNELLKSRLTHSTAALLIATLGFTAGNGVYAQDADSAINDDEDEVEEVIVTGSRIRRNEFTSASPIQVISGQTSREIGLFNAADMLQASAQASGLQIDNTFNSFVLDNGPGAATISFRGLDAERTLVLINGRRVAPAGVGGAPTATDLNLIPSIMIDRIESLLDGASAVYGSDAVAGVANVIMRKDVEGFEVEGSWSEPFEPGGQERTISAIWGTTGDRGSFQIAGEYYKRDKVRFRDRDITRECDSFYYEDGQGNILTEFRGLAPGTTPSSCKLDTINRVFYPFVFGNIWYTEGRSNLTNDGTVFGVPFDGIPNFSDTAIGLGLEQFNPNALTIIDINGDGIDDSALIDPDGDGLTDVDLQTPFYNAQLSDRYQNADFLAGIERYSVFANGEYTVDEDTDTTVYVEGWFSERKQNIFSPGATIFPEVPVTNPFNPCSQLDCLGFFGPFAGQAEMTPIVAIRDDRDRNIVKVNQYRLLGGVRGDITAMDDFLLGNWAYDVHGSFSRSKGTDRQRGIREDRLLLSIDTTIEDPSNPGSFICGVDADNDGVPDGTDGCVPVNMFASSIYQAGGGTFATQAETDYLFDDRFFETIIEQTVVSGFLTGDLFELPWNNSVVPIVFGYEYRRDSIESNPNDVAANGELFAFFADQGADGARSLNEFFAETRFEFLKGKPWAEELTLEASLRWTDESNFSPAWTYSFKGIYRPINYLTFRATYGTAYRAPNLRESFLNGVTGFNPITDPCVVPLDAREPIDPSDPTGGSQYRPDGDTRAQNVLDACRADGVDPLTTGLNPNINTNYTVEISTGGTDQLNPEDSRSITAGIVFEQPFTDAFDLSLSVTYFDIKVTDSIEEPFNQFLINDCYDNPDQLNATSDFCSRITRGDDGLVELLDASFINIGRLTSRGFDLNGFYQQDFEVGDEILSVSLDVRASHIREQIVEIIDFIDDNAGEPTTPHWRAQGTLQVDYGDFGFNWFTRWIQGGENTPPEFDPLGTPCDGLPTACRPVFFTTNYDVHDMSLTWNPGDIVFTLGISNVFDVKPPRIDTDGVFGVRNFPLGVGYDLQGRTIFTSAKIAF